jgi:spermidine synthase
MIGQPLRVIVEVSGGVAWVTHCPDGVEVIIIDHDNEEADEDELRGEKYEDQDRGVDPDKVL